MQLNSICTQASKKQMHSEKEQNEKKSFHTKRNDGSVRKNVQGTNWCSTPRVWQNSAHEAIGAVWCFCEVHWPSNSTTFQWVSASQLFVLSLNWYGNQMVITQGYFASFVI